MKDAPALKTTARVIHWAFWYDVLVKVVTMGREGAFWERLLDLVRLAPGEVVLDAGSGTGTLAIAAQRRVAPSGAVYGIDASAEMECPRRLSIIRSFDQEQAPLVRDALERVQVAVRNNPLDDINHVRAVELVIKDGIVVADHRAARA